MPNIRAGRDTRSKKRRREALNRDLESQGVYSDEAEQMLLVIQIENALKGLLKRGEIEKFNQWFKDNAEKTKRLGISKEKLEKKILELPK